MRHFGRHHHRHIGAVLSASDVRVVWPGPEVAAERRQGTRSLLRHTFVRIVVQTLGPINNVALPFLSDLLRRISQVPNENAFLLERLSVLIQ